MESPPRGGLWLQPASRCFLIFVWRDACVALQCLPKGIHLFTEIEREREKESLRYACTATHARHKNTHTCHRCWRCARIHAQLVDSSLSLDAYIIQDDASQCAAARCQKTRYPSKPNCCHTYKYQHKKDQTINAGMPVAKRSPHARGPHSHCSARPPGRN